MAMRLEQRLASATRGFTLAELLVATTLLTITMTAVYTAFSGALGAWRRGEANYQTFDTARLTLGLMSREIAGMHPAAGHLIEGSDDELEFFALTAPMHVEEGHEPRMMKIHYRMSSVRRDAGRELIRNEAPVEGALPQEPKETDAIDTARIELGRERRFVLAENIKDMEFVYHWAPPANYLLRGPDEPPREPTMVKREENPRGFGQPHAIEIRLTVHDSIAESGESTFTEMITFRHTDDPPRDVLEELMALNLEGYEYEERTEQ